MTLGQMCVVVFSYYQNQGIKRKSNIFKRDRTTIYVKNVTQLEFTYKFIQYTYTHSETFKTSGTSITKIKKKKNVYIFFLSYLG